MNRTTRALWAKKQEANGRLLWLSLMQHLEDTRETIGLLWEHWLSSGQREFLINAISTPSEENTKHLVQFLGSIHDLGKATPAFQTMKGYANSEDLDIALMEKLEAVGFLGISQLVLTASKSTPHALAGQNLLLSYGVGDDIASIVGAHHGKPTEEPGKENPLKAYPANYFQREQSEDPIYQRWEQVQKNIFNWALQVNGFDFIEDLPQITQPAQVVLSGLVMMADWIASNEKYFPLIDLVEDCIKDQRMRREEGWSRWKKTNVWKAETILDSEQHYQQRFQYSPRNVQAVFSKLIEETDNAGMFILEAPMGSGKTEAALVAVEQLAGKKGKSGLFFGLPTQATSNGIFPRIYDWLEKVKDAGCEGEDLPIRLAHGKAALNKTFTDLAKHVDIDGNSHGSIIINEWFSGRKTVALDDFVVGTVDQFLLVALKQKHLALRHLGFGKKVVVIDEVHAYDSYMSQYLYQAVRWMGAYDVPVIILSATLPMEKRHELLKQYLLGKGMRTKEIKKQLSSLSEDAYPLVTYHDGNQVKEMTAFEPEQSKRVIIKKIETEALLDMLDQLVTHDGIIGIIVNTVKKAQDIAMQCTEKYGEEIVELLHSSFIATDRVNKEADLIDMIGKEKVRPKKKIIVGTQVIEQSLDIDFDVMISDLAPIDLLIQRMGRLHRHRINRPEKYSQPMIYLMGTNSDFEFEDGSVAVYGDFLLARTQYFLPEELWLPRDISPLVQKVYGQEEVCLSKEVKERYLKMQATFEDVIKAKEDKAKTFRIASPGLTGDENLFGWLDNSKPSTSDERAYAQVRDSQDTIEVIALKKVGSGYGYFGTDEDISQEIRDYETAKNLTRYTLKLPNALCRPYNIDKTIDELEAANMQYLRNWQEQSWLKGSLGIIFDENHQCELNGFKLHYDEKYGLFYERM